MQFQCPILQQEHEIPPLGHKGGSKSKGRRDPGSYNKLIWKKPSRGEDRCEGKSELKTGRSWLDETRKLAGYPVVSLSERSVALNLQTLPAILCSI